MATEVGTMRSRRAPAPQGRRSVVTASVAIGVVYAAVFAVPPLISPVFVDDLGLTLAQAGLLMTVFTITFAALSLPAGALADRHGPRRVLLAGAVLAGAVSLAFPLSSDLGFLIAMRLMLGAAAALVFTPGISLIRRFHAESAMHRGNAWLQASLALGVAAAYLLTPNLNEWLGWEWTFRVYGLACLTAVATLSAVCPLPHLSAGAQRARSHRRAGTRSAEVMRDGGVLSAAAGLFVGMFVAYGVIVWSVPFFDEVGGFSVSALSLAALVLALMQVPAPLVGGALVHRVGPLAGAAIGFLVAATIAALAIIPADLGLLVIAVAAIAGFGAGVGATPLFALPALVVAPARAATATGFATTIGMGGAIASTYLGGVVSSRLSYDAWFAMLATVAVLGAVVVVPVARLAMARQRARATPDVAPAVTTSSV
jgi:predicted MFS family arabinose efflux permease